MSDVFISYSRRDKEFVHVLYEALQESSYDTWVDWQDIAPTTEWWKEIEAGIEAAHTFIFVISPDSVASEYCHKEIDHAVRHGKRLIPVLRRSDFPKTDMHPKLGQHQWVSFRAEDNFPQAFATLVETINTDLEHKKIHTRLEIRAIEWNQKERDDGLLLRGKELKAAEAWLANYQAVPPHPTGLQQEYIRAGRLTEDSKQRADRRLRRGMLLGSLSAVIGLLIAIYSGAIALRFRVEVQAAREEKDRIEAESNQRIQAAELRISAAEDREHQAQQAVDTAQRNLTLAETAKQAAEAQLQQIQQEAQRRIRDANQQVKSAQQSRERAEQQQQEAESKLEAANDNFRQTEANLENAQANLELAREGSRLERAGNNLLQQLDTSPNPQNIRLLMRAVELGQELNTLSQQQQLSLARYPATSPVMSLQNILNLLATETRNRSSRATPWQPLSNQQGLLTSISFSANGDYLATGDAAGNVRILKLNGLPATATFSAEETTISALELSPTGHYLAILGSNGTIQIWRSDGVKVAAIDSQTGTDFFTDFTFSRDGRQIALKNGEGMVGVWEWSWDTLKTARLIKLMKLESGRINRFSLSPDSRFIAITDLDGQVQLHSLTTDAVKQFESYQQIRKIKISPDAERIVTVDFEGRIHMWNSAGQQLGGLGQMDQRATDISFNQNGQRLAAAYANGTVGTYDVHGLERLLEESCAFLSQYQPEYPEVQQLCQGF